MAKRLTATQSSIDHDGRASRCTICGGSIVVEELARESRYPRRLTCRTCGAEYGTTRTDTRNY